MNTQIAQVKSPELRDIDSISPYEKNAKKHPPDQVKRLAESIKKFGWRGNPIIVDKFGEIIAGHGRRLAALELGLPKVPVVVVEDMSAEEARAFRLADNRVAESSVDGNLLREELIDLDFDLSGIFDDKELAFANADLGELDETVFISDLDKAVEAQREETQRVIAEVGAKPMPVAKAIGFKTFAGENVLTITRFTAFTEAVTGKVGEEAFVDYALMAMKDKS